LFVAEATQYRRRQRVRVDTDSSVSVRRARVGSGRSATRQTLCEDLGRCAGKISAFGFGESVDFEPLQYSRVREELFPYARFTRRRVSSYAVSEPLFEFSRGQNPGQRHRVGASMGLHRLHRSRRDRDTARPALTRVACAMGNRGLRAARDGSARAGGREGRQRRAERTGGME